MIILRKKLYSGISLYCWGFIFENALQRYCLYFTVFSKYKSKSIIQNYPLAISMCHPSKKKQYHLPPFPFTWTQFLQVFPSVNPPSFPFLTHLSVIMFQISTSHFFPSHLSLLFLAFIHLHPTQQVPWLLWFPFCTPSPSSRPRGHTISGSV